jgi:hypothetical protein
MQVNTPFDSGNFYVIPGSSPEVLKANVVLKNNNGIEMRQKYGFNPDDFIIAMVGSHFVYSGIMLEHAVVLKALALLLKQFRSKNGTLCRLKVQILSSNLTDDYKMAIEVIMNENANSHSYPLPRAYIFLFRYRYFHM